MQRIILLLVLFLSPLALAAQEEGTILLKKTTSPLPGNWKLVALNGMNLDDSNVSADGWDGPSALRVHIEFRGQNFLQTSSQTGMTDLLQGRWMLKDGDSSTVIVTHLVLQRGEYTDTMSKPLELRILSCANGVMELIYNSGYDPLRYAPIYPLTRCRFIRVQ